MKQLKTLNKINYAVNIELVIKSLMARNGSSELDIPYSDTMGLPT